MAEALPPSGGSRRVSFHPAHAVDAPQPLHQQSLEAVLTRGLSPQERDGGRSRIHIRRLPVYFTVVLDDLARNEELRRVSVRSRLALKLGMAVLDQEPAARQAVQERQRVLSEFSLRNVLGFYRRPTPYLLQHPVFQQGEGADAELEANAEDGETLSTLQSELHTSRTILALVGLLAAIAQSRQWVRPEAVRIAQQELEHFRHWMEESVSQRIDSAQAWEEWHG